MLTRQINSFTKSIKVKFAKKKRQKVLQDWRNADASQKP